MSTVNKLLRLSVNFTDKLHLTKLDPYYHISIAPYMSTVNKLLRLSLSTIKACVSALTLLICDPPRENQA